MKAMKILCNIHQKEGKDFLGEIYDLRSFVPISNLSEFTHYFPPLNLVKFNPSLPSPPFETHFNSLSSTASSPSAITILQCAALLAAGGYVWLRQMRVFFD